MDNDMALFLYMIGIGTAIIVSVVIYSIVDDCFLHQERMKKLELQQTKCVTEVK